MAIKTTKPDIYSAMFALNTGFDLLKSARDKFDLRSYIEAFDLARDSIRMASSAVLFKDGYISDNFEDTKAYMIRNYPGSYPMTDWQKIEVESIQEKGGMLGILLEAFEKIQKGEEKKAKHALVSAERFLDSARNHVSPQE